MDIFGSTDPRKMPGHFFWRAIHLDYATAIRGNPDKQNYSVCPRHWYIDADFKCAGCDREFTWTAGEQKAWFEDYFFWVDSHPRHCKACMAGKRRIEGLLKEYDGKVAEARKRNNIEEKRRIVEIVAELEAASRLLPQRMIDTRAQFERQLRKQAEGQADNEADA